MKLVCVSDTHNLVGPGFKIPKGDVFIHSGDLTMRGTLPEITMALNWIDTLPHPVKLLVAGNHDFNFQNHPDVTRTLAQQRGITYLCEESAIVDGVKFYGSPWQPWFMDWAFNFDKDDGSHATRTWDKIPADTEVLITHGPPRGILDRNREGIQCGCEYLARRVVQLSNLKYHIFGHIHEAYGERPFMNTRFINASICDRSYKPVNAPVEIEI